MTIHRTAALVALAALCTLGAACAKKKVAAAPPPPPPPPAAATSTPAPARVARSEPARPAPSEPVKSRYPDAATRARIDELLARIQDAYFDYDKHSLRPDAEKTLLADAQTLGDILRQYPDYKLTVEGHCDERGSVEYNMALGDARAKAAKEYISTLGVPAEQLQVVSYGKERPQCTEHDESCWQKNRRAHIIAMAK